MTSDPSQPICLSYYLFSAPVYTHVTRCTAALSILYIMDCMRTIRFCLLIILSSFFFPIQESQYS